MRKDRIYEGGQDVCKRSGCMREVYGRTGGMRADSRYELGGP